tara:strand:- start:467 stop:1801 length:1335 start_codon:yes stop_codon:yes gene_type:complete
MCGVIGIYNVPEASKYVTLGLHSLQHRGQEGAGILSKKYDSNKIYSHKDYGSVHDIFSSEKYNLPGTMSIGHVRYSTTGGTGESNVQPLYGELDFGQFSVAHNGNLTNAKQMRSELIDKGSIFQTTTDTENIIHVVATGSKDCTPVERFINCVKKMEGAFSVIAFMNNKMIIARDPNGYRPLCYGKFNDGYAVASESCALDMIGVDKIETVQEGEVIVLDNDTVEKYTAEQIGWNVKKKFCIFEYIYFARPDSIIDNKLVYQVRKQIGKVLAYESSVDCDMIVPVPDSGVPVALGYAQAVDKPFELAITRSHYPGRTFIQPEQKIRNLGVKLKHSPMALMKGKSVTLIDDSIVRGTTSKKIIEMVRDAGAKEVHIRIGSPPTTGPCFYGIDTPKRQDLLASHLTIEEIRKYIGADTLSYLSINGLYNSLQQNTGYCDACFTGNY